MERMEGFEPSIADLESDALSRLATRAYNKFKLLNILPSSKLAIAVN